jgi:signal peptidase I
MMLWLRWLVGMLIIFMASVPGLVLLVVVVTRSWHLDLPVEKIEMVGLICFIPSFIFFFLLEQNLWLSHFMRFQISSNASRLKETFFFLVLGVLVPFLRSTKGTKAYPDTKPREATAPPDTVREVLETVAFVVVLVLLLKTFVAEAFVIPTGSMATTLLGYNKKVTCPRCGVTFPVNCSDEVENRNADRLSECDCWNCRYHIDFNRERTTNESWREPSTSSGDRVLVAKFLWELGLSDVKPLDVVVFKFPEGPQKKHVPTNFIKRLIGLPNQIICVYYGDIYVARKEDLIRKGVTFTRAEWLKKIKHYRTLLEDERNKADFEQKEAQISKWEKTLQGYQKLIEEDDSLPLRRRLLKNHPRIKELIEGGDTSFKILRKPPEKILSMYRPVYDNDHPAQDLEAAKFPPRWAPEADGEAKEQSSGNAYKQKRLRAEEDPHAWKAKEGQAFGFDSRQDDRTSWLRYRNLLPRSSRGGSFLDRKDSLDVESLDIRPELISDFMSYNSGNVSPAVQGNRWVGDLILECEVKVEKADNKEAELILELSKGPDRFQARFQLQTGVCTLLRNGKELASKLKGIKGTGTFRLRFANVDRRLTVWVDRELPFDDGQGYDPPRAGRRILHGPDERNDLEPASVGARGGAVLSVGKLKLWRDTYYLSGVDGTESVTDEVFFDPTKWAKEYTSEALTMFVQPGHFLCLGDNSPSSSDSRLWGPDRGDTRGGLVPKRLMLGRALMIYFPFNRAGRIR